jgi:hypothetical protein
MCKRLALLLPLLMTMCATTPTTWQKAGVDNATMTKDSDDCQTAAEREAVLRYPYGFNYGPSAAGGGIAAQQRDETNRSTVEASLFKSCMEGKGYTRS